MSIRPPVCLCLVLPPLFVASCFLLKNYSQTLDELSSFLLSLFVLYMDVAGPYCTAAKLNLRYTLAF